MQFREAIAPVVAIRGNIDKTGRAADLPDVQDLEFLGHEENRDRLIFAASLMTWS
ncbi:hypothetical protein [Marinobacter sp.]|uniref:hypothetical protein n=1 Tax=Marinobacter sp. TaxID=50741 RepID=UPI003A8FD712